MLSFALTAPEMGQPAAAVPSIKVLVGGGVPPPGPVPPPPEELHPLQIPSAEAATAIRRFFLFSMAILKSHLFSTHRMVESAYRIEFPNLCEGWGDYTLLLYAGQRRLRARNMENQTAARRDPPPLLALPRRER